MTQDPAAQEQPTQSQPAQQAPVPQQPVQAPPVQAPAGGPSSTAGSASTGVLTTDDGANPPAAPMTAAQVGTENIQDQFSAVINIHGCNLQQIETAIQANMHQVDPHPAVAGAWLRRHPVYIACFDTSQLDEQGRPAPGEPLELDVDTIRGIYAKRYAHVAAEPPPQDGSHIQVKGMHTIAELDSRGVATGRVRLGSPDELPPPPPDTPVQAPPTQQVPQAQQLQAQQPQQQGGRV